MKRRTAGAALVALACLAAAPAQTQTQQPAALRPLEPRPRLVLFVSVDQLRYEYFTRLDGQFVGGLRRILDSGALFTEARYRHANTETGPGHAVLVSGRNGSHSGIIANEWWDGLAHAMVNVVDDAAQSPVGGAARAASPANFLGFTIGDALKRASPSSRVVSLAFKDRAAVLMGGRRADAAFWFDDAAGRFVSSTYYMHALPPWLAAWQQKRPADAFFGHPWTRLLPDVALYERLAGKDAQEGEWEPPDIVFPHALKGKPPEEQFYYSLRRTAYADELTLDLALKAMDAYALGRRGVTDVLFVGFSSLDGVGHTFGPDSQEAMDTVLRLDRVLQRLFDAAGTVTGGRALIVLAADHGSMPLVELLKQRGVDARRVNPAVIEEAAAKALQARFPQAAGLVERYDPPNFYLDIAAIERQGLRRADVEAAIAEAVMSTGLALRVYTHASFLGPPPAGDPDFPLFRASFFAPRSPHVIVRLKEHVVVDERTRGTGHGSPNEYDRHVPLAFLGPGIAKGRMDAACGPEDLAPTLAALLGLEYPMQDAQRLLTEVAPR